MNRGLQLMYFQREQLFNLCDLNTLLLITELSLRR